MIDLRKATILTAIASSALILSACNLYKTSSDQTGAGTTTSPADGQEDVSNQEASAAVVTFTDSGASPATVTIKSGESITWTNNGTKTIQVGSANHPTHTVNPELTDGEFVIELAPGESNTVTLEKAGSFGYHDHLNVSVFGKVVVE